MSKELKNQLRIVSSIALSRLEHYQAISGKDEEREYWKGYAQAIQDLAKINDIEIEGITGVDIKYSYF